MNLVSGIDIQLLQKPPKPEENIAPKAMAKRAERARAAAERKALRELPAERLDLLLNARQMVGSNRRQIMRLQRYDAVKDLVCIDLEAERSCVVEKNI